MIRFPVFLARSRYRDRSGTLISLSERRLIRQNADDPIIAIVSAPLGSRVRTKPDANGPDQLIVPLGRTILGRIFGARVAIPAKYLIGDAHRKVHGLALLDCPSEAVSP